MRNKRNLWVIVPVVMLSALVYTSHAKSTMNSANHKTENVKCGSDNCNCADCKCGSNCNCEMCD